MGIAMEAGDGTRASLETGAVESRQYPVSASEWTMAGVSAPHGGVAIQTSMATPPAYLYATACHYGRLMRVKSFLTLGGEHQPSYRR
jgi:hypothetical protein